MIEESAIDWRALRWLATSYVGRTVIVRPASPDALWMGVCGASDGRIVIEVNCTKHRTVLSLARTFFHEIAHAKFHPLGPMVADASYQPGPGWACRLYPDRAVSIAVHKAATELSVKHEREAQAWADAEIRTYTRWILERIFLRRSNTETIP